MFQRNTSKIPFDRCATDQIRRIQLAETAWYKTERHTEALVKAVVAECGVHGLAGEDIWYLLQLTWITASKDGVSSDHWKRLKVPALAHLFQTKAEISDDLGDTLASMRLPRRVAVTAAEKTGFVNTYRPYRNSLLGWCRQHSRQLLPILDFALKLKANNQDRFDLASEIAKLPRVSTPNNERTMAASNHITPLIACLDPKNRFPILNGEAGVNQRLAKLGLKHAGLEEQVRGFIGLIGQFGLTDAFAVDTMTEAQMQNITKRVKHRSEPPKEEGNGAPLALFDEEERKAVTESSTVVYRKRHNKMTNRLEQLLPDHKITQGASADCRYDALIENYDGNGRDLLLEAKPDANKGSVRIAIGQLLDYRRFLPNQAGTDLAILTIASPSPSHIELMHDLQITALWFTDESCRRLSGTGDSWRSLELQLARG